MQFTIRQIISGDCLLCEKDKEELFDISTADQSFDGLFCHPCFRKIIRMKVAKSNGKPKEDANLLPQASVVTDEFDAA